MCDQVVATSVAARFATTGPLWLATNLFCRPAESALRGLLWATDNPQFGIYMALLRAFNYVSYHHSISVALLAMGIALLLQWSHPEVIEVGTAGLLHDLGKAKMPVHILRKPGALNQREWALMHRHPEVERADIASFPF